MDHHWVKLEITPVHVLPAAGINEEPVVVVDPDDQAEATLMTQYGCYVCDEPLNNETFGTECTGIGDDGTVTQVEGWPFDNNRRHSGEN